MDRYEYKIRADEIKSLISEMRYQEAVKIADTIDWKRVRSVPMLGKISDLYKINRRYEESRDILLLAYERNPLGRSIVSSLCEISIKLGDFVQAVEYYKEFVRICPRDSARYILQYKLYVAQDVSLEERIAVLEEFKKHEYVEKWAYELAYLYHRVGLTTECIEECDEMFIMFGDGRYVMKALELKALHESLSPEQKARYERYKAGLSGTVIDPADLEKDVAPKPDYSNVNYVNEQAEIPAEQINPEENIYNEQINADNLYSDNTAQVPDDTLVVGLKQPTKELPDMSAYGTYDTDDTTIYEPVRGSISQQYNSSAYNQEAVSAEAAGMEQPVYENETYMNSAETDDIQVPTMDDGDFSTYTFQNELAESLKEVIDDGSNQEQQINQNAFYKNTVFTDEPLQEEIPGSVIRPNVNYQNNSHFDSMLSQEYDGQISLAIDEEKQVEKQITGQISISDFMQNWEAYKKQQQEQQLERIRKRVTNEAGNMFADFEESAKDGLQEKIEQAITDAIKTERQNKAFGENNFANSEAVDELEVEDLAELESDELIENMVAEVNETVSEPEFAGEVIRPQQPGGYFARFQKEEANDTEYSFEENYISSEDALTDQADTDEDMQQTAEVYDDYNDVDVSNEEQIFDNNLEQLSAAEESEVSDAIEEPDFDEAVNAAISAVNDNQNDTEEDEVREIIERELAEDVIEEDPVTESEVETEETVVNNSEEYLGEDAEETKETDDSIKAITEETEEVVSEEPVSEESIETEEPEPEAIVEDTNDEGSPESETVNETEKDVSDAAKGVSENTDEKANDISEADETVKEEVKEEAKEDDTKKKPDNKAINERLRVMTPEEKQLFGPYIHHRKSRRQIIKAIDNMSMDAFSGNVIVTGEEGAGTVNLAKGLIKAVQASDSNFSGKVAKTTANTLNKKSVGGILDKLANGALIIQRAADLKEETVVSLTKALQNENKGIIIVMEDTKGDMDNFLEKNPALKKNFNVRVDIEALDDDSLVAYAKQYALEKEYAIDNLGILALHTVIAENQRLDHEVTISEVKDIVDDAIYYANKRTVGHYFDTIFGKRYDEEDMIILREKDFMH